MKPSFAALLSPHPHNAKSTALPKTTKQTNKQTNPNTPPHLNTKQNKTKHGPVRTKKATRTQVHATQARRLARIEAGGGQGCAQDGACVVLSESTSRTHTAPPPWPCATSAKYHKSTCTSGVFRLLISFATKALKSPFVLNCLSLFHTDSLVFSTLN